MAIKCSRPWTVVTFVLKALQAAEACGRMNGKRVTPHTSKVSKDLHTARCGPIKAIGA